MATDSLYDVVDRVLADPADVAIARGLFGCEPSPARIADDIDRLCTRYLGASAERCLYAELSSGAVFGLVLDDDRRVALKVHDQRFALSQIASVAAIQRNLIRSGFPCSAVIRNPVQHGRNAISFERWDTSGTPRSAFDADVRDGMAACLADLVRRLRGDSSATGLKSEGLPASLWPAPHNALFDFPATRAGAEWIEDHARLSRLVLESAVWPRCAGHMDWSVKHFRFSPDASPAVIYDWDSLRTAAEVRIVGGAAATFTVRFEPARSGTPDPDYAYAFVAAYERQRRAPFSPAEWRAVSAAALHTLTYCARCEHAIAPRVRQYPEHSFRRRLQDISGEGYFPV